jgi:aryl-alcohol dehydrogenase-like predicted oxidoreductase
MVRQRWIGNVDLTHYRSRFTNRLPNDKALLISATTLTQLAENDDAFDVNPRYQKLAAIDAIHLHFS